MLIGNRSIGVEIHIAQIPTTGTSFRIRLSSNNNKGIFVKLHLSLEKGLMNGK